VLQFPTTLARICSLLLLAHFYTSVTAVFQRQCLALIAVRAVESKYQWAGGFGSSALPAILDSTELADTYLEQPL